MSVGKLIERGLFREFRGRCIDEATDLSLPLVVSESTPLVEVKTTRKVQLVVWHKTPMPSALTLRLAPNTNLSMTDIYTSTKYSATNIEQAESSECSVVSLVVGGAKVGYEVMLNGTHSEFVLNGAFIASGSHHAAVKVVTRHNNTDSKSRTIVKGVASGRAMGEFRGLVYVAKDAQRTDAEQLNRNIEIDGGHILSEPQLEIYADDVRCSHGSTVGQLDEQSLYYMRQRGISHEVAERMLLEGFVADVVSKCDVEALEGELYEILQEAL